MRMKCRLEIGADWRRRGDLFVDQVTKIKSLCHMSMRILKLAYSDADFVTFLHGNVSTRKHHHRYMPYVSEVHIQIHAVLRAEAPARAHVRFFHAGLNITAYFYTRHAR